MQVRRDGAERPDFLAHAHDRAVVEVMIAQHEATRLLKQTALTSRNIATSSAFTKVSPVIAKASDSVPAGKHREGGNKAPEGGEFRWFIGEPGEFHARGA